jgi:hypothetical protein
MKYPRMVATLSFMSLGFAACSSSNDFHPTDAEVARLEASLDGHRCVGDLQNWQRTYVRMPVFSQAEVEAARKENRMERLENFDKRMIEFTLRRADGRNVVAGRVKPQRPEDFDLESVCAGPDCLLGGYAIPRDELYLTCEKRAAS